MKFRSLRSFLSVFLLLCTFHSFAHAFANNILRVTRFQWMHVQTEHFDIYYDVTTERLVPRMAMYLENAWQQVGDKLNFHVQGRTPFFFYSNHNEFEQTNIVPTGEGTGGVTEAFKNRLVIFNDGSETWLRHVIFHEFTHVVQFNVLYGGFWKSVRLLKSPFYPLWFMEGMAEFGSGDVDAPLGDMVVRDAVYTKTLIGLPELQGFGHLKPNQVTLGYKTGEAAIAFLAHEYGPDKVGHLLRTMESHFDVSSALEQDLGLDLNRFDFRFQEWLADYYQDFFAHAKTPPDYGPRITQKDALPQSNEAPVISSDGKKMYFFSDRGGPTQVYEYDFETKQERPLVKLKWSVYENLHPEGRALSLSVDGKWLAFSGEKKQRDYLFLLDIPHRRLHKIKTPYEEIRSPVFSPVDNNLLVCVALNRGYTDLYLIDRDGHEVKRLTNNPQNENSPTFSPDGKHVVYSAEMVSGNSQEPAGRDLMSLDLQGSTTPVRMTSLEGIEYDPEVLPDGSIVFVRDRNDAGAYGYNLYQLVPSSAGVNQLTDLIGGAFSPRYSTARHALYYVGFHAGEKHVYEMGPDHYSFDESRVPKAPTASAESKGPDLFADRPLSEKGKALTQALNSWPTGLVSPIISGIPAPYRFKASTDLFLPFIFYSTLDGLVAADIWQVSDLFGNHQFQQQMQYASGSNFVDLAMFYTYARFRPMFTVGFRTQTYFEDFEEQHKRHDVSGIGLMTYPLDRVSSLEAGVGATDRHETFLDESEPNDFENERFYLLGYTFDTVTGRYLLPTKGQRLGVFFQSSAKKLGGNQQYNTTGLDASNYVSLPRESTWAARLFATRSTGSEPQVFRLGGIDRVRALSGGDLALRKSNVVIASNELRLRLSYLNARTKFLFPDFFFKAAYLVLFDDAGYGWDNRDERDMYKPNLTDNSMGVGISWPTFILQSFQIDFTIQWAKRTDVHQEVWYISVGPSF